MGVFYQQLDNPIQQMHDDGKLFDSLLESSLEVELSNKLKSSLVGGYSKKSVEEFVAEMQGNLLQIKNQLEQQIHDITVEKANVSRECEVLREQLQSAEANISKIQSQIMEQTLLEGKLEASQKELRDSRSEVQQLHGMLAKYEDLRQEKEQLKLEIKAKEQRIEDLDIELARYKQRCQTLEQERNNFEVQLHNVQMDQDSAANREEIEHYRNLLQKAETRTKEVEQKLRDAERACRELELVSDGSSEEAKRLAEQEKRITEIEQNLAQKEQFLQEQERKLVTDRTALEENLAQKEQLLQERERKFAAEQTMLEQNLAQKEQILRERERKLVTEQETLEKNQMNIQDLYNQLQENMEKNRRLTLQLNEKNAVSSQKMEQLEEKLQEKERELSEVKERIGLRAESEQNIMERVDQLFQSYTKNQERVQLLESEMTKKDALVQHYQKCEQENILLRRECDRERKTAIQLKEALEKVLKEMEGQAEGVQMYVTRAMQEREALQRTISELTALKLEHVELMDSMTRLTESYAALQTEKEKLEVEFERLKTSCGTKVYNLENIFSEKESTHSEDLTLEKCSKALERAKLLIQQFDTEDNKGLSQNA